MPRSTAPVSPRGVENGMPSRPKRHAHDFDEHDRQAEGQQQRIIDAAPVERPHQEALSEHSDRAHAERHQHQAHPEVSGLREQPHAHVRADHEECAVREIHYRQHAEDQRQPERDQHVHRAERDAGDDLQQQKIEGYSSHKTLATEDTENHREKDPAGIRISHDQTAARRIERRLASARIPNELSAAFCVLRIIRPCARDPGRSAAPSHFALSMLMMSNTSFLSLTWLPGFDCSRIIDCTDWWSHLR